MGIEAALIGGGLGLLGSSMAADAAGDAAAASAQAQTEAARIAAEEARFRPVGVTTAFGTSNFGFGDDGRLSSAGYTLTPQMQAIRDQLLASAGGQGLQTAQQGLQAGQGLFGLGQQYLAQSPQQAAQQWMASQQDLLAPARERALAGLQTNLFNTGRGGLSVGATGMRPGGGEGLRASNPQLEAYYNALAQQDAQLAAQAQEQGRAQTTFGAGLLGSGINLQSSGYSPFQTQLGLAGTVESLGQGAFDLGTGLGAKVMTGGSQAANALMQGGTNAARTLQAANSYSPVGSALMGASTNQQLLSGLGGLFGGTNSMGNPTYNPYTGYGGWSGTSLANTFYGTGGIGD